MIKVKVKYRIKKYLITFLTLIFLFLILKIIAYSLPNDRVKYHIDESTELINKEGIYREPFLNNGGLSFKLDNFTDSLILNMALNKGTYKNEAIIKKSVKDSYYMNNQKNIMQSLITSSVNATVYNNTAYSRYWHGVQVVVRPLLLFFNYSEIRVIFMILTILLLCISFTLTSKNIGLLYSSALSISLALMSVFLNPMSIQYSAMTILCLLSTIIVNLLYLYNKDKYIFLTMFIIGCLACYFDLLTFPLITFGIPLIISIISEIKYHNSNISEQLKIIFILGICWLLGYALTFLAKWVLASIIMGQNIIIDSLKQFITRSDINGVQNISKIDTIRINFSLYFNHIAIFTIVVSLVIWLILFKYRKKIINMIPVLLVGIVPYIWYLILTQHSYIHSFFTNKIQAITMFSILSSLIVTTNFSKGKKEEIKEVLHTFVVLAYKESPYLEECIKSVLNQKFQSRVIIATSTPNKYIEKMAKKYKLDIIVNKNKKGIGADFDFAISCCDEGLVTIAHQDDIYDYEYSNNIVNSYKKHPNCSIIFTDYYEINNDTKILGNANLNIKRGLLYLLRFDGKTKFSKRFCLRFGNAICCPSVTFNKTNIKLPIFDHPLKSNVDWYAWEILSRKKERFNYVPIILMGHRIHDESTTTEIIKDNIRTKEDLEILKKFWPNGIARIINKFYKRSEKNNKK